MALNAESRANNCVNTNGKKRRSFLALLCFLPPVTRNAGLHRSSLRNPVRLPRRDPLGACCIISLPLGWFDPEIRQRKLQALGGPLVELDRIVPWGMFRETLGSCVTPQEGNIFAVHRAYLSRYPFLLKEGSISPGILPPNSLPI